METFDSLSASLLEYLSENGVKATEVRNHIAALPTALIREAGSILDKDADRLDEKKTLTGLYTFLNQSMWNFLDYHLLEYVIKKFGGDSLKSRMKQYVCKLEAFENHTSIHDLMEFWLGQGRTPVGFSEAALKIDRDPKHCTVAELNALRQKLCVQFWPRLSDCAKFIMHHSRHWNGCYFVVWVYPSGLTAEFEKVYPLGLTAALEEAISKSTTLTLLKESKVISLSVDNKPLFVDTESSTPGKACRAQYNYLRMGGHFVRLKIKTGV